MKGRIHNSNIDVEIEGDDEKDILEQFVRDYPARAHESVAIEWTRDAKEA
jgi:hypothetical protein